MLLSLLLLLLLLLLVLFAPFPNKLKFLAQSGRRGTKKAPKRKERNFEWLASVRRLMRAAG